MEFFFVPVKNEPLWESTEPACPTADESYISQGLPRQGKTARAISREKQGTAQSHVPLASKAKLELGEAVIKEEQSVTSDVRRVKHEQSFRTELYPEEFPAQCSLDHHALRHRSPTGPRSTEITSPDSGSKDQITMHTRQVKKEKQRYQCDVCAKTYAHVSSLQVHKRFHADQLPYACHLCPARFVRNSALRLHFLARHDVTRHPECVRCGKRFTFRSNLERHMKAHREEAPHACHLCPRKFARKDNLLLHLRVHTDERPHCCTECGKRFVTASVLAVHSRSVHCPEPTFLCVLCPKRYKRADALRAHLKTHHSQVSKK